MRRLPVARFSGEGGSSSADLVAVEEPLEIRVAGETFAVTMRTPGHDEELALGFLFGEGLVTSRRDVGKIAHCGSVEDTGRENTLDVTAAPGTAFDVERVGGLRRGTLTTASCGVCGRRSIDDLLARCRRVEDATRFSAAVVPRLVEGLRAAQATFADTGGLHAAGIATPGGVFRVVREDVGRHNAVDKVVGRALMDDGVPLAGQALVVSGRASFEIVQKAVAAGAPLVVAVSAPSTLAIETAERGGVTLVGFARDGRFNAYAHPQRIG